MHYILVLILFSYSAFAISAQEILDKNPNKQGILPNNKLIYHGQAYQDEFAWLRDADHPIINDAKIKRFIKDENAKSAKYFAENSELLRTVFEEIKSRRGKLEKPATEDKTYIYTSKYLGENQYITHFYTDKVTGKKAVMLDENLRAKSFDHYELNAWSVSPNAKFLAWVEDTAGSNKGVLYVKSLQTSNINSLTIANVGASIVWNDKSNKRLWRQ